MAQCSFLLLKNPAAGIRGQAEEDVIVLGPDVEPDARVVLAAMDLQHRLSADVVRADVVVEDERRVLRSADVVRVVVVDSKG